MMTRNQTRRVEIACPVLSSEIKKELLDYLERLITDNTKARVLQPDGNYIALTPGDNEPLDVQRYYIDQPISHEVTAAPKPKLIDRLKQLFAKK